MSGRRWHAARVLVGLGVLVVLAWQVGAAPFAQGLRAVTPGSVLWALALVAGTTVCCSWRWRAIARAGGVELGLGPAVGAYYRSQFLNSVLPGGVLGDVHRGFAHGCLRSVFWDRVVGQTVQVGASVVVLAVAWPGSSLSPGTRAAMGLAGVLAVLGLLGALAARGVLDARTMPIVVATSLLAFAGHVALLLVAARAAGVTSGPGLLLPAAVVVLSAAAVPLNVAGWGPREGAAAWAFAVVGLGAAAGTSTAVAYGVLSLLAVLPGAALLVVRPGTRPGASLVREAVPAHG